MVLHLTSSRASLRVPPVLHSCRRPFVRPLSTPSSRPFASAPLPAPVVTSAASCLPPAPSLCDNVPLPARLLLAGLRDTPSLLLAACLPSGFGRLSALALFTRLSRYAPPWRLPLRWLRDTPSPLLAARLPCRSGRLSALACLTRLSRRAPSWPAAASLR